jgi:hypothetical protein
MSIKLRQELERRIVKAVVTEALLTGHTVSVFDGEETTVNKSAKLADIMGAIMTTDEDALYIWNAEGKHIGTVILIYGNEGYDVIADYSANPAIEAILAPANAIAESYA